MMALKELIQKPTHLKRKVNYPILGLLVATFILLVVVGFLTYLNYNREENLLKDHLKRQGLTLIRALEAGARTGMMGMHWGNSQLETLFSETAKGPNIDRILLVDEKRQIIIDSNPTLSNWYPENFAGPTQNDGTVTLIFKKTSGENIYRIIRHFIPLSYGQSMSMMGAWMQLFRRSDLSSGRYFIVLDLKMQEYQAAQAEDVRLAVLYGLILFIIGSASLYFLFLAQNYYMINRALKTMESYTQNVVESMPNGLISLDKEGHIKTINRNAIRLLKLDSEAVKGRLLHEVLPKCRLPEAIHSETDILQQQVECHLKDGSTIPLSTTWSRLRDETGEIIGWVVILRDLRDIRSLEKQIQRSERLASLGRMAAGIAHEIRNPLGTIKGFGQYFRNKFPEGSEDRNYATVLVNEVDRLNRVIQDLLNFAKPQEPKLAPVDLQELIMHAIKLVKPDLQAKKIKVVQSFNTNKSRIIMADADMLTQVFLNLFLNAIDAMEENGILEIAIKEDKEILTVIIRDSGNGIPKENLSRIFDPFFTSKKDGTGLGLAIVHRIMESHQGEITVNSQPGKGTTFFLHFRR